MADSLSIRPSTTVSDEVPEGLEGLLDHLASKFAHWTEEELNEMWQRYDSDCNGELSQKENLEVIRDLLKMWQEAVQEIAPDLVVALISVSPISIDSSESSALKTLKDVMATSLQELLASLQQELASVARDIWNQMDENQDAMVTQQNFVDTFPICCENLLQLLVQRGLYSVMAAKSINWAQFCSFQGTASNWEDSFNSTVARLANIELVKDTPLSLPEFWRQIRAMFPDTRPAQLPKAAGATPAAASAASPISESSRWKCTPRSRIDTKDSTRSSTHDLLDDEFPIPTDEMWQRADDGPQDESTLRVRVMRATLQTMPTPPCRVVLGLAGRVWTTRPSTSLVWNEMFVFQVPNTRCPPLSMEVVDATGKLGTAMADVNSLQLDTPSILSLPFPGGEIVVELSLNTNVGSQSPVELEISVLELQCRLPNSSPPLIVELRMGPHRQCTRPASPGSPVWGEQFHFSGTPPLQVILWAGDRCLGSAQVHTFDGVARHALPIARDIVLQMEVTAKAKADPPRQELEPPKQSIAAPAVQKGKLKVTVVEVTLPSLAPQPSAVAVSLHLGQQQFSTASMVPQSRVFFNASFQFLTPPVAEPLMVMLVDPIRPAQEVLARGAIEWDHLAPGSVLQSSVSLGRGATAVISLEVPSRTTDGAMLRVRVGNALNLEHAFPPFSVLVQQGDQQQRTRAKDGAATVEWNEDLYFWPREGDPLIVELLGHDHNGSVSLGTRVISLRAIQPGMPTQEVVDLPNNSLLFLDLELRQGMPRNNKLRVVVEHGHPLQSGGAAEASVILKLDGQSRQTQSRRLVPSALWNEEFVFAVGDTSSVLDVELRCGHSLGWAAVHLQSLMRGVPTTHTVILGNVSVQLQLEAIDFGVSAQLAPPQPAVPQRGGLRVVVLQALDILAGEPFVILRLGHQQHRTSALLSQRAAWNEEFIFPTITASAELSVEVLDQQRADNTRFVGRGVLPLSGLQRGIRKRTAVSLSHGGILYLEVELWPSDSTLSPDRRLSSPTATISPRTGSEFKRPDSISSPPSHAGRPTSPSTASHEWNASHSELKHDSHSPFSVKVVRVLCPLLQPQKPTYVVLRLGPQRRQTCPQRASQSGPTSFDEDLSFPLRSSYEHMMLVELYQQISVKDECIGCAAVDVRWLRPGESKELTACLTPSGRVFMVLSEPMEPFSRLPSPPRATTAPAPSLTIPSIHSLLDRTPVSVTITSTSLRHTRSSSPSAANVSHEWSTPYADAQASPNQSSCNESLAPLRPGESS